AEVPADARPLGQVARRAERGGDTGGDRAVFDRRRSDAFDASREDQRRGAGEPDAHRAPLPYAPTCRCLAVAWIRRRNGGPRRMSMALCVLLAAQSWSFDVGPAPLVKASNVGGTIRVEAVPGHGVGIRAEASGGTDEERAR